MNMLGLVLKSTLEGGLRLAVRLWVDHALRRAPATDWLIAGLVATVQPGCARHRGRWGGGGGGGGTDENEMARRRGGGWRHSASQRDLLRRLCTLNEQAMALRKEQWPALSRRLGRGSVTRQTLCRGAEAKIRKGVSSFFFAPGCPETGKQ